MLKRSGKEKSEINGLKGIVTCFCYDARTGEASPRRIALVVFSKTNLNMEQYAVRLGTGLSVSGFYAEASTALRPRCRAAVATLLAVIAVFGVAGRVMAVPPDVEMWRMDCGEFKDFKIEYMSDVFAYPGKKKTLSNGCYLIRHERQFMLWDTGFSPSSLSKYKAMVAMSQTLFAQLHKIDVKPEQISVIGLSHYDFDHTGQAANFPKARLFMGKADFDYMTTGKDAVAAAEDVAPWRSSGANVEAVVGDKDIFGDGSVVMLATPGHTEGHHSLLVRLPTFGSVVLSGDLWHFAEQLSHNGMPPRPNTDRADILASMDRVQKIVSNLKATLVIQHEIADIGKLPMFPASAH